MSWAVPERLPEAELLDVRTTGASSGGTATFGGVGDRYYRLRLGDASASGLPKL